MTEKSRPRLPSSDLIGPGRVLVWFSCGAASACAAKIASEFYADQRLEIIYCDTLAFEHPDNQRFMDDVSQWIDRPVMLLKSKRFEDIYDVFTRERYLNGRNGAPCTRALKRDVRKAYQRATDLHVFGFTVDEGGRIADFETDNPGVECVWILEELGITKSHCYRMLREASIELPTMYKLGYKNNNCIGCVKGGAGYWNKIRRDFPESFSRMARQERVIDFALLRIKGKPCFLDELPENAGRYNAEPDIECGPQCVSPASGLAVLA